jgi:hypothetical protein
MQSRWIIYGLTNLSLLIVIFLGTSALGRNAGLRSVALMFSHQNLPS